MLIQHPIAPLWKGELEHQFCLLNDAVIDFQPGAVREREPGRPDYRLDASLTLRGFRRLLIDYIIEHNTTLEVRSNHIDPGVVADGINPHPYELWKWGVQNCSGILREESLESIRLALMPDDTAWVTRDGIHFGKLHYTCKRAEQEDWFGDVRRGKSSWTVPIIHDPRSKDHIILLLYVHRGRPRVDDLLLRMGELAFRHSIGVLVIDEIQNLRKAKGDGANDMLDFLLWLDNKLGIPVVLVGTPKALPVLTGEFRRARRAAGQEAIAWNRMREGSDDWKLFTDTLWKYQYIHTNCLLTPELRHALYYESQGIVDIAVKVFMLAQIEAITTRTEVITEESLIAAAQHRLGFVQPFLADLRNNVAPEKIEAPEDLAEVNLGRIVEEELERIYECGTPRTLEPAETQPQDAVSVDSEQETAPEANVSSEPESPQSRRKQAGEVVAQIALIQARDMGKRESVPPYEALKARGYTREALEYLAIRK